MNDEDLSIDLLKGRTLVRIDGAKDDVQLVFTTTEGDAYMLYHEQDCCESVWLEDVAGDLGDLIGEPLLAAEEVSSEPGTHNNSINIAGRSEQYGYTESCTWTYYKLATRKGSVTLRWCGVSNGYYSEKVDFCKVEPEEQEQ